jgi:hypothetical protein
MKEFADGSITLAEFREKCPSAEVILLERGNDEMAPDVAAQLSKSLTRCFSGKFLVVHMPENESPSSDFYECLVNGVPGLVEYVRSKV